MENSIRELGCEYLDLCLVHWPDAQKPGTTEPDAGVTMQETWCAAALGWGHDNEDEGQAVAAVHRHSMRCDQVSHHKPRLHFDEAWPTLHTSCDRRKKRNFLAVWQARDGGVGGRRPGQVDRRVQLLGGAD